MKERGEKGAQEKVEVKGEGAEEQEVEQKMEKELHAQAQQREPKHQERKHLFSTPCPFCTGWDAPPQGKLYPTMWHVLTCSSNSS